MAVLLEQLFPARSESLSLVRGAVRVASQGTGCAEECIEQLVLAVNEACMNIIQHGYAFADGQQFKLCLLRDENFLVVQLFDGGSPASLDCLRPRSLDDLRPGGLGVRFMREVTDSLEYLAPPPGYNNLLQLRKRIQ